MPEKDHKLQFLHAVAVIGWAYWPLRTTTDETGKELLLGKDKMMGYDVDKSITCQCHGDQAPPLSWCHSSNSPFSFGGNKVTWLLDSHKTSFINIPHVFCLKTIPLVDCGQLTGKLSHLLRWSSSVFANVSPEACLLKGFCASSWSWWTSLLLQLQLLTILLAWATHKILPSHKRTCKPKTMKTLTKLDMQQKSLLGIAASCCA